MFFHFLDWDSFEQKCLSILNQCSSEELERMNRRLSDVIPGVKLETDVQDPYGLFSLMVNAELLSPDNLYFLDTLLPILDLRREMLKDQQFGGKLIVLKTSFCPRRTAICVPGS